eukprot:s2228_g2.t1
MGFGPSAGWAQGLTDVVAEDANLSAERRLHPDHVVPSSLPVWGSIVDDIWAIEHAETQLDAGVGAAWMDAAEKAWVSRGVEPNLKKSVDSALGEEIQGYYVHPYGHWVGVSLEKRRWLFQATIHILRQRTVLVGVIERVVGKHGFVHSARPALRSVFEVTYSWLATLHRRRHGHVALPREVWIELAVSAMLLPYASLNLSSEWSNRVECTDASMSGIGRAWGVVPQHVAQTLARYADHATVYTNLKLPWGIGLNKEHKCPLRRIRVPIERIKWHKVGCPWRASHITLGEADAIVWAAEDRLRRPSDFNCRFVHPVDSAACAGCFSKGRMQVVYCDTRYVQHQLLISELLLAESLLRQGGVFDRIADQLRTLFAQQAETQKEIASLRAQLRERVEEKVVPSDQCWATLKTQMFPNLYKKEALPEAREPLPPPAEKVRQTEPQESQSRAASEAAGRREDLPKAASSSKRKGKLWTLPAGSAASMLLGRWHGLDHNARKKQWHEVYICEKTGRLRCTTWTDGVAPRGGRVMPQLHSAKRTSSITIRNSGDEVLWGKGEIILDAREIHHGKAVWSNPDPKKEDWIWAPGW